MTGLHENSGDSPSDEAYKAEFIDSIMPASIAPAEAELFRQRATEAIDSMTNQHVSLDDATVFLVCKSSFLGSFTSPVDLMQNTQDMNAQPRVLWACDAFAKGILPEDADPFIPLAPPINLDDFR